MPPKRKIRRTSLKKGKCAIYLNNEYNIDFDGLPSDFKLLNGHGLYCLLLNLRSIPSTVKTLDKVLATEHTTTSSVVWLLRKYDSFIKSSHDEAGFTRFKLFCEEDFVIRIPVPKERVKKLEDIVEVSTKDMALASPSTRTQCTRCDCFRISIRSEQEKGRNYRKIIRQLKADMKKQTHKRFNEQIKRKNMTILRLKGKLALKTTII